jgi:hypothetical protein
MYISVPYNIWKVFIINIAYNKYVRSPELGTLRQSASSLIEHFTVGFISIPQWKYHYSLKYRMLASTISHLSLLHSRRLRNSLTNRRYNGRKWINAKHTFFCRMGPVLHVSTHLAFCGPTDLASYDELAVMAVSGIRPSSIPRAVRHSPETLTFLITYIAFEIKFYTPKYTSSYLHFI